MNRPLTYLISSACVIIIFAGLNAAQPIVLPVLLAGFFSVLFAAVQSRLARHGLPVPVAFIATITLVIVSFSVLVNILTASMTAFIADLPMLSQQLDVYMRKLDVYIRKLPYVIDLVNDLSLTSLIQPETALALLQTSLKNLLGAMNNLLLVVFLILFMLLESTHMQQKLSRLGSNELVAGFSQFTQKVNSYMIYKGFFSCVTGLCIALGLWLTGIDYFVLWGFLAFLLNFIPTVGSIIAAIPPLLLALVSGNLIDIPLVAGLFLIVNILIGNFIEPRFMGQGMGLSPLVVFVSLIFWGWLFGIVGMFLSVPLTMVIKIGLQSTGHQKVAALLEP